MKLVLQYLVKLIYFATANFKIISLLAQTNAIYICLYLPGKCLKTINNRNQNGQNFGTLKCFLSSDDFKFTGNVPAT